MKRFKCDTMTPPKDPIKLQQYLLKQSLSHMGKKRSPESLIKASASLKAISTPERRFMLGNSMRGKKHTPETILKMRNTALLSGRAPPDNKGNNRGMLGVKLTPEQKLQRGTIRKGAILSPETKIKISNSLKGRKMPDEIKLKISKTITGTKRSEEFKQNRRGANNPRWKGGISFEPYCPKFNKDFKERVRTYFGNTCVECNKTKTKPKLTVHHIFGNKQTCCDSSIPLFVPLCKSCHGKVTDEKDIAYSEMIKTNHGGKCYLTKDEMKALRGG